MWTSRFPRRNSKCPSRPANARCRQVYSGLPEAVGFEVAPAIIASADVSIYHFGRLNAVLRCGQSYSPPSALSHSECADCTRHDFFATPKYLDTTDRIDQGQFRKSDACEANRTLRARQQPSRDSRLSRLAVSSAGRISDKGNFFGPFNFETCEIDSESVVDRASAVTGVFP